jgi:hypothetical protein
MDVGPPEEGERRPLPGSGAQQIDPTKINDFSVARPDEIDYGVLDFASRLGSLLDVPLIACEPASEGSEFRYPKGDRDKLSSVDNQTQLTMWQPGSAIMARMGGTVAAVDVDPRNHADIDKTRLMLDGLGVRVYAEIETPGGGRHFYVAGHPELASAHNLDGWPGIDVQSFGSLLFLPGTQRPRYGGAGYRVIADNLEALADGGDPDGGVALAGWVAEHRGTRADFAPAPLWNGKPPDARHAAYPRAVLQRMHSELSAMPKDSGRNTGTYNAALACGNLIAGAGMDEAQAGGTLLDACNHNGLIREDGESAVRATIASGIRNGRQRPRAVPQPSNDSPEPPEPDPPEQVDLAAELWESREVLRHIHTFARARRVGPWAMLGCVLAQTVAAVTPKITIPPLVGGHASLNLFLGIVSETGGGKGSAEDAALAAIDLPPTLTIGPGSGEGLGHLFMHRDKDRELRQHTTAVILSAAEVETMAALKGRQASTLFPELRKAWKGESLGFAYADPSKRLTVAPHIYRLCLIVGIQPAIATPILEDADAGMPQRFLWLPADDPDAPDVAPGQPPRWHWSPRWTPHDAIADPQALRPMAVCETARIEIDQARLRRLRGETSGDLDGHALLAQLKVAAALALLDERTESINEEDWYLAGTVRRVSDRTREKMITTLNRAKARSNRARGEAEAERAILVDNRQREHGTQLAGKSIMRQLDKTRDWLSRSRLRGSLASGDRGYFEDAITALIEAGQVDERAIQDQHAGHQGIEYRRAR